MAELDPLFLALQEAVAGRYSLERELGRGGMGVVYLARDVSLDRLVAIKLLPPDLAARPTLRERFLREARLAARLSHPNIVPIHAVEEHGRLVWFVMAYIPGESLGARLRARGSLPPGDAARLLRDVAWALGYAHSQGVVHRDVKPDNILLESGGRRALIADFGIAAPIEHDGEVAGTVAYLSPEQATGDRVDGRSDLYALGVVAYYALSARLPYPVTTLPELVERQIAGAPAPLTQAAPHVPRALCRTVDRCLAPLATSRFQTGEELAGALDQLGSTASDLPAPLRVWVTQGMQRRGPFVFISVAWGVPMLVGGLFAAIAEGGKESAFVLMGMGAFVILASLAAFTLIRVLHTRRLLGAGYGHADIVQALAQHIERRREELAFEHGVQRTLQGRIVNGVLIGLALTSLGSLIGLMDSGPGAGVLAGLTFFSGIGAVVVYYLRNLVPGARIGTRDRLAELAHRFWKGAAGRWLTRVAGWRLSNRGVPEQLLHRPTELALGDAADALFRALPAAERRDLKQLPDQIKYLSAQAQHMRRKLEELDDLIAQAAPTTLFEGEKASGDGGAGALGEARTLWAARLKETVSMLESLRLGLLKLHAGSATPETLTDDLAAAHQLRERLGLLLEAHGEADTFLRGRDG